MRLTIMEGRCDSNTGGLFCVVVVACMTFHILAVVTLCISLPAPCSVLCYTVLCSFDVRVPMLYKGNTSGTCRLRPRR